jgi:hypothetical protein
VDAEGKVSIEINDVKDLLLDRPWVLNVKLTLKWLLMS